MIVFGIDPGIATTGWGVISKESRGVKFVDCGIVATAAGLPIGERLQTIYEDLTTLFGRYKPAAIAVEELFFNTNAKTALIVGQARGVAILASQLYGAPIASYTPLQVKMGVSGYGRADKKQVQEMVKTLLKLDKIPKPDDAADALAIALTHAVTLRLK